MSEELIKQLILLFAVLSAILIYFSFFYSFLKKNSHIKLCKLFSDRFGSLPETILPYRNGGFMFTFQKDTYFHVILTFKKHSWPVRNIPDEHYDFIRNLPSQFTRWIKIKFYLLFIGLVGLFLSALLFLYVR